MIKLPAITLSMSFLLMYSDDLSMQSAMVHKKSIDGQDLKKLVEAGLTWLRTNQQIVNALKCFSAFPMAILARIWC